MMVHMTAAFPHLHGRPAKGWVNDPNGCSYVDGRFHVFFQYNPDDPTHRAIRWGHMSSTDLAHWREEPVALLNRPGELDAYGCWSGCVVDDAGVPTAVYSAVADAGHRAEVVLARSDRTMTTWHQDRTSVMTQPDDPTISDVRDPFVFTADDGHRYAVQGAGNNDGTGPARILVYRCDELTRWTPLGDLLTADDPVAGAVAPALVWECPNLVRFGDRWVLIVSMWCGPNRLAGVRYLCGDLKLTPDGPRFRARSGGTLDTGPCFYAPHVLAADGRILLWAWAWEHSPGLPADQDWAGSLTFCRELFLDGDALLSRPVPELTVLRREPLDVTAPFAGHAFEAEIGPAAGRISLSIVDGDRTEPVLDLPAAATPRRGFTARILVDGSMVEAFDGAGSAHTTRAYPTETSRWRLRTAGPVPIAAWRLGPATSS
jgi:beta-fructofuranosidase